MTLVARIGALSDIGLHRKTNEDAFVLDAPLFAVCDGMGGALAGEVASGLATETLAAKVREGSGLLEAAEAANAAVFAKAESDPDHTGMGTTLTGVLFEGDSGRFVHIGDSRAYLLRAGELRQLSADHSLVGEMVREGRLTEEEAAVHPHRSVLSRALGTEPSVAIDEFAVDLEEGDVLLLCSDGLSGVVPAAGLRKALGRDDPQDAAARLIAEARKRGGPDNITAVVLRLERTTPADEADTAVLAADEVATAALPLPDLGAPEPADLVAAPSEPAAAEETEPDAPDAAAEGGAHDAPAPERRSRLGLGIVAGALALLFVVMLTWAVTTTTVFYIGVDNGRLTVYSGVPVKVGSVQINAVYRRSARAYASLTPAQRALVDAQSLHDRAGVLSLAAALGMWP